MNMGFQRKTGGKDWEEVCLEVGGGGGADFDQTLIGISRWRPCPFIGLPVVRFC